MIDTPTRRIPINTDSAFDYYQRIRPRLPTGQASLNDGQSSVRADNLIELAAHYDVFVFDAFGVLNVGQTAIPGARECITQLRELGKSVFVLTNGASASLDRLPQKFERLHFDFTNEEIISSRLAAEIALTRISESATNDITWGAITGGISSAEDLPVKALVLDENPADHSHTAELLQRVDAIVMLSSVTWDEHQQVWLQHALQLRPRPLIVANPDVVAPHEQGFSLEPGYYSHELLDAIPLDVEFHGKPFPSVFELVRERVDNTIPNHRIAMLGDTLHTDILGAKAVGWGAILVADHGLFRGRDVQPFIERSGIIPDWIIPAI